MKLSITFKETFLLSRLYIDINSCLSLVNDMLIAHDYIDVRQDDFFKFKREMNDEESRVPFEEKEDCYIFFQIVLCRLWDLFILYLKQAIFAMEMKEKDFSKNKAKKIDQYNYEKIKEELDRLGICKKYDQGWDNLKKIKKFRDNQTHQHRLCNLMKFSFFKSEKFLENKNHKIIPEDVFKAAKYIVAFSKPIDAKLMKECNTLSLFLDSPKQWKQTLDRPLNFKKVSSN